MKQVAKLLELPVHVDNRGILTWAQFPTHLPFTPVRIFFIRDVPRGEIRGNHAHVKCDQIFIAVAGSFLIDCRNDKHFTSSLMWPPSREMPVAYTAMHVPAGYNVTLSEFCDDAACLVLASHKYDPDDYI